ncbi:MAG: complex I subunit 5 family protein [Rhodocyclaceae bacterium]
MSEVIDAFGLILTPALPLALVMLWCVPALRGRIACWTPLAALPALLLAQGVTPGSSVRLDWLLFGTELGLDPTTRVFLVFSALLWLGAGWYTRGTLTGDPRAGSFRLLWLATMAGNFGLILARDVASFYAFFALMTFAAYGLVIHARSAEALRAGRAYLAMAVLGEGLIIAGLLLAAHATDAALGARLADLPAAVAASPTRDLTIACLLLGFGVKAGLPLLHMWLPLAHPVAPIPASAVLSGAMIKAGLLGWLQTLPLGLVPLPGWGGGLVAAGLVAAWGAAWIGIHQRTPKTVLAYSSISQMGLITVGIGAGLHQPALWPALLPAIAVYAMHHALSKGALFLGVGVAAGVGAGDHRLPHRGRRAALWLALALPGLSLAGPMVSGAAAKIGLKQALEGGTATPEWWAWLPLLLALAAVGTTALIARYLWLLAHAKGSSPAERSQWAGWGGVLAASVVGLIALPWVAVPGGMPPNPAYLPDLLWPVLAGTVLAVVAARRGRAWSIPAGDVLVPLTTAGRHLLGMGTAAVGVLAGLQSRALARLAAAAAALQARDAERSRLELLLRRNAGLAFAMLVAGALLGALVARLG